MKKIFITLLVCSAVLSSCVQTHVVDTDGGVKETQGQTDSAESEGATQTSEQSQTDAPIQTEAETEKEEIVYTYDFISDLSEYEMYMEPEDRDGYLILVNKDNTLPEDYVPEGMIDVADTRKDGRDTQQMCLYASKALEAMLIEARANGCEGLSVTSAYRSYDYQYKLYNQYIDKEMSRHPSWTKEEAIAEVNTYSAIAGTSEHQTGLACDMHNLSSAKVEFADTPESEWLEDNCYKFGFILRYEEDKMDITGGIIYEPWHFRYVGRYHASRMHELDYCLEEYIEYLNNN